MPHTWRNVINSAPEAATSRRGATHPIQGKN